MSMRTSGVVAALMLLTAGVLEIQQQGAADSNSGTPGVIHLRTIAIYILNLWRICCR
jgi:hypothetical protein